MTTLANPNSPPGSPRNYFGKIKLAWRLIGISLRDADSVLYKIYTFLIFIPIMTVYMVLDVKEIFTSDAEDANSLVLFFFPMFLGLIKSYYILGNRLKIRNLLNKIEEEPFTPNPDRGSVDTEEKLIKKYVWITNLQAHVYWICAYASVFLDSSITISKRMRSSDYHDWEFSYGNFAILNVTYSPNYEICWAYQTLSVVVIGTHFITADLVIASILAHTSCQFQILQNYIKQIPRITYEEMVKEPGCNGLTSYIENSSVIPWKYLKKSLKRAVNYHLAIIGIAEEVEALFKRLLLVVFITTLGVLCFFLYHASKVPVTDPRLVGAAGYIVTACAQVLALCYWGEQVTLQSQEVGRAAFETSYVGTDVRFQKSLALIIRRSQNPSCITTNNFAVIGLPTLLWIIRTSYSAFMMLRRLQS